MVRSIDIKAKKEYNYLYENGEIYRSTESNIELTSDEIVIKKSLVCTVNYRYNSEDSLTKKRIIWADGKENVINYENLKNDSQIVKFTAGGKTVTSHSKTDSFGRKVFDELQLSTGFVSRQFSYVVGETTDEHVESGKLKSSPTTQLVSQIVMADGHTISYEYDAEERITKVTDSIDGVTEYTYDELGQLLTETKNGEVINTMVYDAYGNILQKNGIPYTYNAIWKDRLSYYNGEHLIYDAQGNPTNYLDHNLTWEKGRQLKSFDDITYTYNANGIRTSKTVNGVKYTYVLDGTKILRETWGSNVMDTLYDNEDSVCGIVYNGDAYYFLKNLQGDVIAITDSTGETVAEYTYDAWGKLLSVSGDNISIASINPYRYRGYYFDSQTNLYYLQSRYYDANIGRFINGDEVETVTIPEQILQHNLFAYCENDCVNNCDIIGLASLKSILSDLVPRLIKAASKFGDFLLKAFGLSNKKYSHKKKYNNASKLMSYVNDNKRKLKKATGIFGKIGTALECIVIVVECYSKIKSNLSKSSFFQIAELIFYALKIAFQKGISKFISWVISTIGWMIWWAKFLIEVALEYLIDVFFKTFLASAETYFANYLDRKRLTIGNCFVALFKSFKKCF